MAYESQILDVAAKNQGLWNKNWSKFGFDANPGVYWNGTNYIFRDPYTGTFKKTTDLATAYRAAGITAGEEGSASNPVIAANQNFNLNKGQVTYDNKTKSYYFKDPESGKILTTKDLASAYNVISPSIGEPGPGGSILTNTGETPASGTRPSGLGKQFFQPIYQGQYANYLEPDYNFRPSANYGILDTVLGQNPAGNGVGTADLSAYMPSGIGQIQTPFSYNPYSYRDMYQAAMMQAQPNRGQFSNYDVYSAPTSQGLGTIQSPFSSGASQGAFGGGIGGTSLYTGGK